MTTAKIDWQQGAGGRRDSKGVRSHVHTAVFKIDYQQGPPVFHRELCSMLCDNRDGREFGGEWI